MNLITVITRFPDQEACLEHLEKIRWAGDPYCPHCGSDHVGRKGESDRIGRWNCHSCHASFNVLVGTIFFKTRIPLQKWFLAVCLVLNAKKSLSSPQLARDLNLTQPTALRIMKQIRKQMAGGQENAALLHGIVEADETYIGGRPRKQNVRSDDEPQAPRGRATSKTPVIGAVERGGQVAARVADDLSGKGILKFIRESVDPAGSDLITDEYRAYNAVRKIIPHAVINHSCSYAEGEIHTNSIEGFWSLLKRAWYGSHHHYSKKYIYLYIAETCWKYNNRKNDNLFGTFMQGCFA